MGIKKPNEMMGIVMGKKQVEKSVTIHDIPGVVCDNKGNQKLAVKMKKVVLVPDCTFLTCFAFPND